MKKFLFLLGGLMLLVASSSDAQMQPPPFKLQASVVSSMMNSLSVVLVWPDVNAAIYPSPERFTVYKKKGAVADSGKFELVWTTREGKFMDHNVSLGKTYSYYVAANYKNQSDVFSDTVQVQVIEANDIIAKVSGTVADEATLTPLKRAKVEFLPATFMAGHPSCAITDSTGSFTLKLKPGDYFIFSGAEGYVPEFYDNALTMQQAKKVTLISGDSVSFDIALKQLVLPNVFSVSGTVKDAAGNPQKAMITAVITNRKQNHMPDPQGHSYGIKTDELGNFKLFARENDTLVVFIDPADRSLQRQYYNNKTTFETANRIIVAQDITGIDVTLASKTVYDNGISGTITDSATSSPLKAVVYAYKKKSNAHQGSKNFVLSDSLTGT
ncbi:MAG: carboxypeptidase-like regulatory domain-containing protein, partial [Ignavibacteria bacterium]|nr:carboxypeptidase-like regulatory domain-containing protein [Ignavibacteria bacterium]